MSRAREGDGRLREAEPYEIDLGSSRRWHCVLAAPRRPPSLALGYSPLSLALGASTP